MKLPCEVIIWYVLPAVRKEVAKSLIRDHGLSQAGAAQKLGVSEATVSQYLSGKRARININDRIVLKQIEISAEKIFKEDETVMLMELCEICDTIKKRDLLPKIYEENLGKPMPSINNCPNIGRN